MNKRLSIGFVATLGICGFVLTGSNVSADEINTNVILAESAAISVDANAVLNIQSSNAGTFGQTSFNVTAATNSSAGYTLTMSTNSTDLTSGNNTIPALSYIAGGRTAAEFGANSGDMNKWGVSIDDTNSYNPVALSSDIKVTDAPTASDVTTINIGSKVDFDTPSGAYTTTLNFSIVVNMVNPDFAYAYRTNGKTKTQQGYYRMQDMNSSICAAADEHSEIQVQDIRDNKLYWILKAKDGKCWMTQNLDLDLETTPTNVLALTSENTDINTWDGRTNDSKYTATDGYSESNNVITWTPPSGTISGGNGTFTWANNQDFVKVMDPGNWFMTSTYFASSNCPNAAGCNYLKGNSKGYFYQNDSPTAEEMHYHIGNYYNWISAVATNTITEYITKTVGDTSNNPKNSICPKGWRLPVIATDSTKDDYVSLTNAYPSTDTNKKDLGLISAPLYFIRGGVARDNTIQYTGGSIAYYSSTVSSNDSTSTTADAHSLDASTTSLELKKNQEGWRGRFVRCIAR